MRYDDFLNDMLMDQNRDEDFAPSQQSEYNISSDAKGFERDENAPKSLGLALQGGGAHGAFTWGVLDALLEHGVFQIEGLSGTSAGAMNALSVAQGFAQGGFEGARQCLHSFWQGVSELDVSYFFRPTDADKIKGYHGLHNSPFFKGFSALQSMFSPYELNPHNVNPFADYLRSFFDIPLLKEASTKIFLCATHVMSGKLKIFTNKDLSVESILASACLPWLFQAVQVDGEYYWDGGFVGNPAIFPIIYHCQTADVLVVQLTKMRRNTVPTTTREIIDRHKEITYNGCLMREMRSIAFISKLIDRGIIDRNRMKRLNMHLLRDEDVFSHLDLSSALNADWEFLMFLRDRGRATAHNWLAHHGHRVGVESTANIEEDFVD